MISRVLAADLPRHVGEHVRIAGWLHRRRELKSVTFLIVRDRSGLAQVVLPGPRPAHASGQPPAPAAGLPEESVIEVTGTVVASAEAPGGAELHEPAVTALSDPAAPPPFDLYRPTLTAGLPTILDGAPTTLRHPLLGPASRSPRPAWPGSATALDGLGFTEVHTPKIVESATESGANVFGIDYFGHPAYLAQSPQFYKQALVGVFERVFEVGPVFRAEPHDTARHLAQYTSLDAELGFITGYQDVMAVLRDAIAGMAARAAERAQAALELLEREAPVVPEEIPAIHFADAQELIAGTRAGTRAASPTCPPPTSGGWASGRCASTGRSSCSSPATRWRSGRSTPTPTRRGPVTPTAST